MPLRYHLEDAWVFLVVALACAPVLIADWCSDYSEHEMALTTPGDAW